MTAPFATLLSPLTIRGRQLRNRVVFAAHTTSFSQDGIPGTRARAYYAARAAGGAAMIVMEPLPVLPSGGVTPQNYRFRDDRFVDGLRDVVDAVHREGAMLVSQLYHLGPNADPVATGEGLWSVSGGPPPDGSPGMMRAIDEVDIAALVNAHVDAAETACAAGIDGVECMFAYDTLVDGFMSEARNRRSDGYGGALENRLRLAREILDALRDTIGTELLLGVTLTAAMPRYVEAVAHLHEQCDVDYFAIGNGNYDRLDLLMPTLDFAPGYGVGLARAAKRAVPDAIVVAEGRVNTPALAEQALREGSCDLVGMVRAQIADPNLVLKASEDRATELHECVALNVCVARRLRKFPIACVQNPDAGHENARFASSAAPRRVVVVGAGVAGLEAARTAALAGHEVHVLERGPAAGGQVALTALLPRQAAHAALVSSRLGDLDRLGVSVRYCCDADPDAVAELEPDRVLVATGSTPAPRFRDALSVIAVLTAPALPDGPIVVVDEEGHRKGAGVAELLAAAGRDVTLVGDGIAPLGTLVYSLAEAPMREGLRAQGVRVLKAVGIAVEPHRVVVETARGRTQLETETIVHAGRHDSEDRLVSALRERGIAATAIGDARVPRLLEDAIRSGWTAGREL
jgi:2,4-dienoyl-CoA reductase-like NADH-dependent reductase (Old Yellow Enzyme family)